MIAGALLLTACSDNDPLRPDPIAITGAYTLQTINGRGLPLRLFDLQNAFVIDQVGGSMTISANQTFREEDFLETRYTDPETGPVVESSSVIFTGAWENQDSVLTLTTASRTANGTTAPFTDVMFGFVSGNRLTLSFESGDSLFTYVYRRN